MEIDGILKAEAGCQIIPANSTHPVTIGFGNGQDNQESWGDRDNAPFDGLIDEVRIYKRILSDCEIDKLADLPCG